MLVARHVAHDMPGQSMIWPSGGRHLWSTGQTSRLDSHQRGHLVYAATGLLAVHSPSGTSIVPANRIAWTPAGIEHYKTMHGQTDMRIVFVVPALAERLPLRPTVFLASGLARELMLALTDCRVDAKAPSRSDRTRDRLQRVLVDELDDGAEPPLQLPMPRDDRLQAVARILIRDPATNAPLTEIGKSVGASARTLSRLLHDELGTSFYAWRTQIRIYQALIFLAENHDTTWTANACGWSNPSSFIAAFTKIMGVTPRQYQANITKSERRAGYDDGPTGESVNQGVQPRAVSDQTAETPA